MNIIKTLTDYIQLKTSSFRLSGYSLQWIKMDKDDNYLYTKIGPRTCVGFHSNLIRFE